MVTGYICVYHTFSMSGHFLAETVTLIPNIPSMFTLQANAMRWEVIRRIEAVMRVFIGQCILAHYTPVYNDQVQD